MARAVKKCSRCKNEKEPSLFNKRTRAADGLDNWCKQCANEASLEYNNSPAGKAKLHKKNIERYGITVEQYNILHEAQNYKCAICKEPEQYFSRLSIDHCHETNRVRGLLCNNCNRGIGLLKDRADILRRAAEYLDG